MAVRKGTAVKKETVKAPDKEENDLQSDGIHDVTTKQTTPLIRASINRVFDDEKSNIKAVASITIGGAYAVHGIKVVTSSKGGDFVAMPNVKFSSGEYKDTFHAITAEARQEMNDVVMSAYEQKLVEIQEQKSQVNAIADQMSMQ